MLSLPNVASLPSFRRLSFAVFVGCALAQPVTPRLLRAQTGPWAHSSPQLKGEALVRDADGGDLREITLIVQGGGDVNWQLEPTGLTPLMAAASADHLDVVRFLIEHGADPSLTDSNGRTALDRARSFGANDVARYLAGSGASRPAPSTAPAPSQRMPGTRGAAGAAPATRPSPAAPRRAAPNAWAPFGSLRTGDTVLFHVSSGWRRGVVRELGPASGARGTGTCSAKKYLIEVVGHGGGTDCVDWGSVAPATREPFWTTFFVGDWALGETMAVNSRVQAGDVWTEFAHMGASEALRVNADGSYSWKNAAGRITSGRWRAAADGPGIVLTRGPRGLDWTLANETNAIAEDVRQIESARLTAAGQMSVAAKRPLTSGGSGR